MGPGARHLALDDNWSGWNWKKILNMGNISFLPRASVADFLLGDFLLRSLLKALVMKFKHTSENQKFDATLPQALRDEWFTMIQNWESDKSSPNPYTHDEKGTMNLWKPPPHAHISTASNFAEVRRKLAEADEEAARRETTSNEVPASVFIRNGLDIEEQQFVTSYSCTPPDSDHTPLQATTRVVR